jgi:GNAT superfamily N-acetyltransferase
MLAGEAGMTERQTARLRDGRILEIEVVAPGEGRGDTPATREILGFVARPFEPWMSAAEEHALAELLSGATAPHLRDWFWLGRLDGRLVATAWSGAGASAPEIGAFGYVLTDPPARGLGIARALTRAAVERFWATGGRALYLGTAEPTAQRVYAESGFRPYNGLVMRAVRPDLDAAAFDAAHFAPDPSARIRDVGPGDLAGFTALLAAPEPRAWTIRHFAEAIFHAPPEVGATGCLRPFHSALARQRSNPANRFRALVTAGGRMLAAASVAGPASGALAGTAALEVLCYPSVRDRLPYLLESTLAATAAAGTRVVHAYADEGDRSDALRESGFRDEAVLRGLLRLGGSEVDVVLLRRDL